LTGLRLDHQDHGLKDFDVNSLAPERETEGEIGVDDPNIDSPENKKRNQANRIQHRRACPRSRAVPGGTGGKTAQRATHLPTWQQNY
jgi:hypothetical protein